MMIWICRFSILAIIFSVAAASAESPAKKVLYVGIDGCRLDAIDYSQAKALKELMAAGAVSDRCDVLGDRSSKADTASGPGWSTAFNGVLADKHHVFGNDFRGNKLAEWPTLFHRLKTECPKLKAVALVSWPPIHEHILGTDVGSRLICDGDKDGYSKADVLVADAAVRTLEREDPDLLFVYLGQVDSAGHGYGFHPKSYKYTNSIEDADTQLARVLEAVRRRPRYPQEDWLVVIVTDHGGQGRGHGGGRNVPEIRTGFLIVSGPAAKKGKMEEKTSLADAVPTVLKHLDIAVNPDWKLDGKPVGLK